ncbi:thioredoxin [Hyphomicrobium sp.]|uniref:thioredoxin n=1 Tax=Hyphomicrobium sp. TaxID=82 RepID=UPI002E358D20|nr:thioredoxin [Hyphomicrobium sp.]HEX2841268.1 thioredoxin [Hyphomicrobium sp.]
MVTNSAGAAELIMVRQAGCPWCTLWDREIGSVYPKSDEGRFAPLRHLDIRAPLPAFVKEPVTVTPTFILVEGSREVGRITGYPGESFFWEMLSEILVLSSFTRGHPP